MLKKLSKIRWFMKERALISFIGIILLILVNFITITTPLVLGEAVDNISNASISFALLRRYVLLLTLLAVGEYIVSCIWSFIVFKNARLLEYKLSSYIMHKILRMPKTFFEKFTSGDLMTRSSSDIEAAGTLMGFGVLALFDSIFYLPIIIIFMSISVSWSLTLFSIIPLVIVAIMTNFAGRYIYEFFTKQQEAVSSMSSKVLEYILGIRLVRAYVLEQRSLESFERSTKEVYDRTLKAEMLTAAFWPFTNIFIALSYAISMIYGANLIAASKISLGDMLTFNIYLSYLVWPMYAIGEFINVAQRGTSSIERIYEVLDEPEEERGQSLIISEEVGDIEFRDYNFTYPTAEYTNLANINLKVLQGTTLGIAGRTGAGKSTLIKQLLLEYPIGSGSILIGGKPIKDIDKKVYMQQLSYVSQDNILFSRTIKENILFGSEESTDEEIAEVIKKADLSRDVERFKDGIDTLLGERGISMSGGQKQRIAIARALIKDAEILILDDCLSAVDAKTEARIIKNIYESRRGKTTIIVSHRLSALAHADEIVVIEGGYIVERGRHEELIEADKWYAAQYKIQELKEEEDE